MQANDIERLRNVMNNISRLNDEWFDTFPTDEGQTGIHDALTCEIVEADKILSAPPRNCDVGTAEEQSRRLAGFCKSHGLVDGISRCEKCRFLGDDNCELVWAQMPYTEGGAS